MNLFPIFVKQGRHADCYRAGFIDAVGEVRIQPDFHGVHTFHEGMASVQFGDLWGFIDEVGKMVIEPFSSGAQSFSEGRAVFSQEARRGVIDRSGKIIVAATYFGIGMYSEGLAWMSDVGAWNSEPGSYGVLDAEGNVKIPFF